MERDGLVQHGRDAQEGERADVHAGLKHLHNLDRHNLADMGRVLKRCFQHSQELITLTMRAICNISPLSVVPLCVHVGASWARTRVCQ